MLGRPDQAFGRVALGKLIGCRAAERADEPVGQLVAFVDVAADLADKLLATTGGCGRFIVEENEFFHAVLTERAEEIFGQLAAFVNVAADLAFPASRRLDFFKRLDTVLAERADDIFGQFVTFVDVAADRAAPLLFVALGRVDLRFDLRLVVAVGAAGNGGDDVAVGQLADKERVAAEVEGIGDAQREVGVGPLGQVEAAVFRTRRFRVLGELIELAAGLHAKQREEREFGFGGDRRQRADAGAGDHIVGEAALDDGDGDSGRVVGDLNGGVDQTGVVAAVFVRGEQVDTVGEVKKRFRIHKEPSLFMIVPK